MSKQSWARAGDWLIPIGLLIAVFALYGATLLPGIGRGDIAELQRVAPTLGIAHPTGYPLYTLLGWLWSQLPLGGSPAWRMNLFSAVCAALAVVLLYCCGRMIGQRRVVGVAAAGALACSITFWSQATIAEVYGLAALLQVLLMLALLGWRAERTPFWVVGLVLGLGLAHHRTIVLLIPGVLVFIALTRWPGWRPIGLALLALASACLSYLYLILHAPPDAALGPWFWQYVTGAGVASSWLDLPRLGAEGWGRVADLARRFVWPQLLPAGLLLALLGAGRLVWRDRATAALVLAGYGLVLGFGLAYYVNDVDVFLIPAHILAALLLGEGVMLLLSALPRRAALPASTLALVLPLVLLTTNIETVRRANHGGSDLLVRQIMAQPLPQYALVIVSWHLSEGLRYMQEAEGKRPDLEFVATNNPSEHAAYVRQALDIQRAVFVLEPWPALGLDQTPEGPLWRVHDRPIELNVERAVHVPWSDGILLRGYSLPPGPYQPGEAVPLTLDWRAQATPTRRYTQFVHLVGADGLVWGQHDREPAFAPTDRWQPGGAYPDLFGPVLSPLAPPGRYQVVVGWYDFTTLHRLPLADTAPAASTSAAWTIGAIVVLADE